jgi:hypothetical protein
LGAWEYYSNGSLPIEKCFYTTSNTLGGMANPIDSSFIFVSETNGLMLGLVYSNALNSITLNFTHNWNTPNWRG